MALFVYNHFWRIIDKNWQFLSVKYNLTIIVTIFLYSFMNDYWYKVTFLVNHPTIILISEGLYYILWQLLKNNLTILVNTHWQFWSLDKLWEKLFFKSTNWQHNLIIVDNYSQYLSTILVTLYIMKTIFLQLNILIT